MFHKSIGLASTVAFAAVMTSFPAHAQTAGCTASGVLPPAFPTHMLIGINSPTPDDTWAKTSGTKWDVQWMYLTGQAGDNWYNGYAPGTAGDGSWIDDAFRTIDSHGFIPGFHLYYIGAGHSGGDPGLLTEIQTASFTTEYFKEFKVLMQKAKAFGKPVVLVLEGDSFGFLANMTSNNPNTMAAVASTGMPELAGLPNTIAGIGMGYLAIRKSVGAYNVAMGPDTPYYAANGDVMNFSPADTDNMAPHVAYAWNFFGPFVGPNATGDRFDFTASCPDASDCAAYNDGRPCWDPSDTASVNTPSINRYVEWLALFNKTSGVNWMLHQVPLGNSQHLNVPFNATMPRSGYKDNKAEYLFQVESPASTAIRNQHMANFANAGVMGILFGSSDDGDSPANDLWTDNLPFLKTHVALLNNAPNTGFAISRSCDGGAPAGSSSSSGGGTTSSSSGGTGTTSSSSGGTTGGSSSGRGTGSSGAGTASSSGSGTAGGGSSDAGASGFGEASTSGGCNLGGRSAPGGHASALLLLSSALLLRRRRSA